MTGAVTRDMRGLCNVVGVLLVGAMTVATVGCAGDEATDSLAGRRTNKSDNSNNGSNAGGDNPGAETGTTSAAVTACNAVAAPTALSDVKDVSDLHVAGTAVFFQSGASVNRVLKNGANKKSVFTSTNLTHSWVDTKGLLIVETTGPDNPNATLRAFNANVEPPTEDNPNPAIPAFPEFPVNEGEGGPGGATANTNFNAASVNVFSADDANYYLTADDGNGNTLIVAVNRGNPGAQTILTTREKVVSNPQIASSAVWWVEEGNRIFKAALPTEEQGPGTPTEVFGIPETCGLVVNESAAFCSVGTSIEQRDLTGTVKPALMDVTASKTPDAKFGLPIYFDSHLYLRPSNPDLEIKNVIRAIATSASPDEKLIACNREGTITGIAVDKDNVVWSEAGVGVFMTTR